MRNENYYFDKIYSAYSVKLFSELYGKDKEVIASQQERYIKAIKAFHKFFPSRENINIYSAPGRTEIGGNHTDHQRGIVLAGAVNLDVIGVVAFHNDNVIRVKSEGYMIAELHVNDVNPNCNDDGTTALVKGILSKFKEKGVVVSGFDMYTTSDVICGGGISSSAAFETLIATVIDSKYNRSQSTPFEIAQYGWYAENVFFGKKCGLLDQTVSSYGGLVSIDFYDISNPMIEKIDFDFQEYGYSLCITDTKSSHENLTDDYVAIREEMKQVAEQFGCEVLSRVNESDFYNSIPKLKKTCSERAILRSMHFFNETHRASMEANALKQGNIHRFLRIVNESGISSGNLLQNLYSTKTPTEQAIPLALTISRMVLGNSGAVRVHGGGFAGTIQAFVPYENVEYYKMRMNELFGSNSCHEMRIRPVGGIKVI